MRIRASASKKEGFSSSHRDEWWKMDSLQQPNEKKVIRTARSCFYVVGSAKYSRWKCYLVYLVRPVGVIYYALLNQTKSSLGNCIERNWWVWVEHSAKNDHNTSRGTKKWFNSMTTLGLTLPNTLKPTWKRSIGNSYNTLNDSLVTIFHNKVAFS